MLPLAAFDILLHKLFFSCMLCLLQMMEFYERVSGARMHAAYVRPGGVALVSVNPSSPNSDQDQFSPNNIHTLSRDTL